MAEVIILSGAPFISWDRWEKQINSAPSHAYLIDGPQGGDLDDFCYRMAASLLCTGEKVYCGLCESCRRLKKEIHPDLQVISGREGSIGIGALRELKPFFSMPPVVSPVKVCLFKEADSMTREAANSVLKVLEEPQPYLRFILTTFRPYRILPTIASRCSRFHLLPLPLPDVAESLASQGGKGFDPYLAAVLSGGYPRRAAEILLDEQWRQSLQKAMQVMENYPYWARKRWETVAGLSALEPEQLQQVLLFIAYILKGIGVIAAGGEEKIKEEKYRLLLEEKAKKTTAAAALAAAREVLRTRDRLLEMNVNRQLQMEALLLKIGVDNRAR